MIYVVVGGNTDWIFAALPFGEWAEKTDTITHLSKARQLTNLGEVRAPSGIPWSISINWWLHVTVAELKASLPSSSLSWKGQFKELLPFPLHNRGQFDYSVLIRLLY